MSDTLEFKDLVVGKEVLLVHAQSARKKRAVLTHLYLEASPPQMLVKPEEDSESRLVYTGGESKFPLAWRFLAPDPGTGDPDAICVLSTWWYLRDPCAQ